MLAVVSVIIVLAPVPLAGQAAQTARTIVPVTTEKNWTPPRTPWGDPDLQGTWPTTEMVGVPFERPSQFGNRLFLTKEEFAQRQEQARKQREADNTGEAEGFNTPPWWIERGQAQRQASLVVDPLDGRLPPMTSEGRKRAAAVRSGFGDNPFDGPEDFSLYDRCITRGVLGTTLPVGYNSGNQIVQTPDSVAIRYEMIHETRLIPIDGRPHVGPSIRTYLGDARGHWEGNTLVVETTNVNGKTGVTGNGRNTPTTDTLRLVERFTRVDADTIQYEVTVDDPKTWTRPWTMAFPWRRNPDYYLYEYACHEGNFGLRNILSGARAAEKAEGAGNTR
jgi:hypothetical protein